MIMAPKWICKRDLQRRCERNLSFNRKLAHTVQSCGATKGLQLKLDGTSWRLPGISLNLLQAVSVSLLSGHGNAGTALPSIEAH